MDSKIKPSLFNFQDTNIFIRTVEMAPDCLIANLGVVICDTILYFFWCTLSVKYWCLFSTVVYACSLAKFNCQV